MPILRLVFCNVPMYAKIQKRMHRYTYQKIVTKTTTEHGLPKGTTIDNTENQLQPLKGLKHKRYNYVPRFRFRSRSRALLEWRLLQQRSFLVFILSFLLIFLFICS